MTPEPPRHPGRGEDGRFANDNHFGQQTRFKPGQCGNPKGRPPTFATYLTRFNERGLGLADLYRVLADPSARRNERDAARWGILWLTSPQPIYRADPIRAKKYYRRWYAKTYERLAAIFLDPKETPERREAARWRLYKWWIGPAQARAA